MRIVKTYFAKKTKTTQPNTLFRKSYVGLISSSQIEEYVGAKGNTLVDHKKRKKYKKGIKDIRT